MSDELQRPCSANDFVAYYEAQGCRIVTTRPGWLYAVKDGEPVEAWSINEGLAVAMGALGESMKAAIQPALDWFDGLPPSAQSALVRKPVQLRKGKRHRPSRHRY